MAQKTSHPDKHQITKGIPKEIRELVDSAIDHAGSIINNVDLLELAMGIFCATTFYEVSRDVKTSMIGFIGGMAAIRGLQSRSEIVGAACVAFIAAQGILLLVPSFYHPEVQVIIKEEQKRIDSSNMSSSEKIQAYIDLMKKYQHPNE